MHPLIHYSGDDVVLTEGRAALAEYFEQRMRQPDFVIARSIRDALERARLRQAGDCSTMPIAVGRRPTAAS